MPCCDLEIIDDLFSFDEEAVFMRAYFDESGKHDAADVITIAGIITSKESWKILQDRWMKILHKLGVDSPFHASDCEAAKRRSQYENMPLRQREEIQETLIHSLKGLNITCAASSLIRKDYTASIAATLRPTEKMRNPWFLVFEMAMGTMMTRTKASTVTFVFDRQDEFSKMAHKLYGEILTQDPKPSYCDRLGTLAFSPKNTVAPLQAIDLIVYEVNRYVRETVLNGEAERWQSRNLRQEVNIDGQLWGKKDLEEIVTLVKEARRERL
jgi:hypothetical protein